MKKKSAFTLIELSVSIAIISILIITVAQGIKIIPSAKLTNARSLTSRSPAALIPGLTAWYETSSADSFKPNEAKDSSQISTWYDISPDSISEKKNTLTRTASAAVTYVAKGINDTPSISFSGSSSNLALATFAQGSTSQSTIFFVARPSTATSSLLMDSSPSSQCAVGINQTSLSINSGILASTGTSTNPVSNMVNKPFIAAIYLNSSSSKAYFNDAMNMAGGALLNSGTNQLIGITIGSGSNGSSAFTGLISEVIIYNRPLKDSERREVMRYLSKKYNLPVSGT